MRRRRRRAVGSVRRRCGPAVGSPGIPVLHTAILFFFSSVPLNKGFPEPVLGLAGARPARLPALSRRNGVGGWEERWEWGGPRPGLA